VGAYSAALEEVIVTATKRSEAEVYDSSPAFREWAAFGDVTYHFTDQLEASAGVG
jgi:hypothetical protein